MPVIYSHATQDFAWRLRESGNQADVMVADDHNPVLRLSTLTTKQLTTIHVLRMNSFLKVCGITFQFNAIATLIVSGILAISRRVRDLTRRLEDHNIEYQHRYRRSRKSSTGCGGLRALYMLMWEWTGSLHWVGLGVHRRTLQVVQGGSSPPISIDVVTNSI